MKNLKNTEIDIVVSADPATPFEDGSIDFSKELESVVTLLQVNNFTDINTSVMDADRANKEYTTAIRLGCGGLTVEEFVYDKDGNLEEERNSSTPFDETGSLNEIFNTVKGMFNYQEHPVLKQHCDNIQFITVRRNELILSIDSDPM